jgi:hypothetical protein
MKIVKKISFGLTGIMAVMAIMGSLLILCWIVTRAYQGLERVYERYDRPVVTGQGYEAVLSFDDGLVLYFNGDEMDAEQWQESMETKIDGKVGFKTLRKAVELNNTDVRRL